MNNGRDIRTIFICHVHRLVDVGRASEHKSPFFETRAEDVKKLLSWYEGLALIVLRST